MKIKRIILSVVSALVLTILFISQSVFAAETGTWKFTEVNAASFPNTISESNPEFGLDYNGNSIGTAITQIGDSAGDRIINAYCAMANVGFENRTIGPNDASIYEDTYTIKYNMNTEQSAVQGQNMYTDNTKYRQILALADLFYLGNSDEELEAYLQPLVNNNTLYYDDYTYAQLKTHDALITPNQIRAVQQVALWYFTNSGIDYTSVDEYNDADDFLYYRTTNTSIYTSLSGTNNIHNIQNNQAKQLYKYLINKATENAANSNYKFINTVNLYLDNSTDDEQPIIEIEPGSLDFDLALRKFITKINNKNITELGYESREPKIDNDNEKNVLENLANQNEITAKKEHTKEALPVAKGDKVTYTIRIYNEGEANGYATEVTDYLPAGLTLATESTINSQYGWQADGQKITTTYLADKEIIACDRDFSKFNDTDAKGKYYYDLEIECIVNNNATPSNLKNIAEITQESDDDNDSTPNNVDKNNYTPTNPDKGRGQEDDDDFEQLTLKEFDLALRKYISKIVLDGSTTYELDDSRSPDVNTSELKYASNGKNNTTAVYNHRKDPIEVKNGSIITYKLVIFNEGEINGRASTVIDQLPEGIVLKNTSNTVQSHKGNTYSISYDENSNKVTFTTEGTNDIVPFDGGSTLDYDVIEVECKVTAQPDEDDDKIFTNIAWIAAHTTGNGTYTYEDRDSNKNGNNTPQVPNNLVTTDGGYINEDKNNGKDWSKSDEYFEGQEDDDDFEKVKIKAVKGSYNIVLVKEDKNGEQLNDTATFEVDGVTKTVTGRLTIVENKKITASSVDEIDTYTIKETVPPDKYCPFDGTIKIEVYKGLENGQYKATSIKYYVDDEEVTENRDDLDVYLNTDGNIYVEVKDYQFDLALRKFITAQTRGEQVTKITDREPEITAEEKTKLYNNETIFDNGTTAAKTHKKDKVEVAVGDIIEYTIRVYNEGDVSGYASEVTDYLPEGLTFKEYTEGDGSINDVNGWQADGQKVTTTKLSNQLIEKFNGTKLDYEDLKIECIVNEKAKTEKASLMNIAEITGDKDEKGNDVEDRDSTPNNVETNPDEYDPGNKTGGKGEEDDDDCEDLKLVEFDLALRKYITKVEDKDGKTVKSNEDLADRNPNEANKIDASTIESATTTATYKHRKDPVVVKPGYFVYYNLTVYNEGDIAGYAKTITDTLPAGVKFIEVADVDNSKFEKQSYDETTNVLVLARKDAYKQQLIAAYDGETLESETVTVKCEVVADKETGADKIYTNIAWISEDYNEKGIKDRDSKTSENPKESKLVTEYPDNGYINKKDNKDKELTSPEEYFKGEQDDDDFEKIIIYKEPDIHKGVKDVKNQDSGYDEDVTTPHEWVINSSLPANVKDYQKYVIVDDIDYRLVYGKVTSVKIIDKQGKTVAELEEGKDKDYVVNYTKNTSNDVSKILGTKYSGTLALTFIDENKAISDKLKANAGNIIEVKFTTTFAKDEKGKLLAEIIGKEIPNKARLEYKNESGEEENSDSEEPEVHTGGVTLYKYKTANNKKVALEGAEFEIYRSEADAKTRATEVKEGTEKSSVKPLQTSKSGKNGLVEFVGLEYGEDAMDDEKNKQADGTYNHDSNKMSTKYWIVETVAPKGYETIKEPIEVTINNDTYKEDVEVLIKEEESKEKTTRLIENKPLEFDLALRKFITAVNEKAPKVSREPVVDTTKLADGTAKTATYTHTKEPLNVVNGDVVTYKLRVYNEGQVDGYASIVTDDIPEGLEFLPEHKLNKTYRWVMYRELKDGEEVKDEDKAKVVECKVTENSETKKYIETTKASEAVIIRTDYLSKEQGEARMKDEDTQNPNLIKAFDGEKLDYKDVELAFRVIEPNGSKRTLINYAQISEDTDEDGEDVTDRDSTPNEWKNGEDDQDIEKIRVPEFDLALRKWVTQAIVIEDGKEKIIETGHDAWDDPEAVVKVELHRKKLSKVTVKFRYSIRVYNQGEIAGYAKEITDYIPAGLKFVAEDNPSWKDEGNNVISTRALENTLLQPGESAEVDVLLTWINGNDNLGLKTNLAEISEDYNEDGVPDKDSTPDNKKPGEDDIDDAPVILSVSTGTGATYIILGTSILVILAGGVFLIKKYVL